MRGKSKVRSALVAAATTATLLAADPALGVNRDGLYTGSTSRDRPIRFEVQGDDIRRMRIRVIHADCNLAVVARSAGVTFSIQDDNTFVMRFFGDDRDDRIVVRGEFTSRLRARGTFRSVQRNRDCRDTVRGTWKVVRTE